MGGKKSKPADKAFILENQLESSQKGPALELNSNFQNSIRSKSVVAPLRS
jgi:hypothetical protein